MKGGSIAEKFEDIGENLKEDSDDEGKAHVPLKKRFAQNKLKNSKTSKIKEPPSLQGDQDQ